MNQSKKSIKKETKPNMFSQESQVSGKFAEGYFHTMDPFNIGYDDIGVIKRIVLNYKDCRN